MRKRKVINQLKCLRDDAQFDLINAYDDVWADDVIALNYAIRSVKKDKRANEYFWKGVVIATIIMLVFHFLWTV